MADLSRKGASPTSITETTFPSSIVGVATAVPIFIGYTATAVVKDESVTLKPVPITSLNHAVNGESVTLKPVPITSLSEYETVFGGSPGQAKLNLYNSIVLFYANGGGSCYVVSVGDYASAVNAPGRPIFDGTKLAQGLAAAGEQMGPTITVIPDAVLLPPDAGNTQKIPTSTAYRTLVRATLMQCATLQDRVALLDLYGTDAIDPESHTLEADITECVTNFHADVGDNGLSYGMAYFPFLEVAGSGAEAPPMLLPPSGAMAGIFTQIDTTRGVWNAPANVVVDGVTKPSLALNAAEQAPLNIPLDGKAVNVIREFTGRGPVVWGARTLDGNSFDYRYVQVRRTLIYIESSIKLALNPFVYAPNDGKTWVAVTGMISAFLQTVWAAGGLMGDKASDAFTVQCGLGSTMTATDILDGYMIVQVTLQMIRPAEFIELTFKQKMQGA